MSSTLGAGGGLIAALRPSGQEPLWVVTGTTPEGVERAANAFNRSSLYRRFAVAITPTGGVLALPRGE